MKRANESIEGGDAKRIRMSEYMQSARESVDVCVNRWENNTVREMYSLYHKAMEELVYFNKEGEKLISEVSNVLTRSIFEEVLIGVRSLMNEMKTFVANYASTVVEDFGVLRNVEDDVYKLLSTALKENSKLKGKDSMTSTIKEEVEHFVQHFTSLQLLERKVMKNGETWKDMVHSAMQNISSQLVRFNAEIVVEEGKRALHSYM